jgi:hypothetical protein
MMIATATRRMTGWWRPLPNSRAANAPATLTRSVPGRHPSIISRLPLTCSRHPGTPICPQAHQVLLLASEIRPTVRWCSTRAYVIGVLVVLERCCCNNQRDTIACSRAIPTLCLAREAQRHGGFVRRHGRQSASATGCHCANPRCLGSNAICMQLDIRTACMDARALTNPRSLARPSRSLRFCCSCLLLDA